MCYYVKDMINQEEKTINKYSKIIAKFIIDNVRFFRFSETIKWQFVKNPDISIIASVNRSTNVISVNYNSVDYAYKTNDLMTIEYFLLHEIRHVFQHLIISDYKNKQPVSIPIEIVEKWVFEMNHYVKAVDNKGNENKGYFEQDCEMDAYAFSYAVMKYKYENVSSLYLPPTFGDEFYEIVNLFIETFKNEKL